jgi:PKD repeat protein
MTSKHLRRTHAALAGVLLAGALLPSAASAYSGTKRLDIETGNLSQFTTTQTERSGASTNPTATVVSRSSDPAHVAQGNYSVRYDMPAHGKRIETPWDFSNSANEFHEGDDVWIARQVFLDPKSWPEQGWNAGHHLTMQIKSANDAVGGPFGLDDRDNRWTWGPSGHTEVITSPVKKGVWIKELYHLKFSSTASKGRITIWHNGTQVYDAARALLFSGYGAYYKQGVYQNPNISAPSRVWMDGTTISTTRAAAEQGAWGGTVAPAPTPTPAPNMSASFTYSPTAPVAGQTTVQFKGTSNRTIKTWDWSLDGVTHLSGQSPTFKFMKAGVKKVALTATASDGTKSTSTQSVTVR